MFNPPHPGLTLRDDVLPVLGLTVTQAAAQLDVSCVVLSRVLNPRAAISPEIALRIEAWPGVARGGEARLRAGRAKRLRRVARRAAIQEDADARSARTPDLLKISAISPLLNED